MAQNVTDKIWSVKELLAKKLLFVKHRLVVQLRELLTERRTYGLYLRFKINA